MSLLNRVLGVIVCLRAHVLGVLTCLHVRVLGMLTCLACLRAIVFGVFTRLRVYVFIMLAYFVSLCAHIFYMLAVLKYAYGLADFFDIVCPIFFVFEKLTSKNLCRKISFFFKEVFRTHLNIYEGVFL